MNLGTSTVSTVYEKFKTLLQYQGLSDLIYNVDYSYKISSDALRQNDHAG
jgi:hypothetical protein